MTDIKKKEGFFSKNLITIILLFTVFLLGFISMGWPYWKTSTELAETQVKMSEMKNQLIREEIRGLLLSSIVEARGDNFRQSLKDASEFFTKLRNEMDTVEVGAYTEEEKIKLKPIFDNRDATIAELAVGEASSIRRLMLIHSIYNSAVGMERSQGTPNIPANSNSANQNTENINTGNTENSNANAEASKPETESNTNAAPSTESKDVKEAEIGPVKPAPPARGTNSNTKSSNF